MLAQLQATNHEHKEAHELDNLDPYQGAPGTGMPSLSVRGVTDFLSNALQILRKDQEVEVNAYFERQGKRVRMLTHWETVHAKSGAGGLGGGESGKGLGRYHKVISHLSKFPNAPSLDQQKFIEAMFAVCLPHIFARGVHIVYVHICMCVLLQGNHSLKPRC